MGVFQTLPDVQNLFPGCGITFANWREVPWIWWHVYVLRVDEEANRQQKQQSKGR